MRHQRAAVGVAADSGIRLQYSVHFDSFIFGISNLNFNLQVYLNRISQSFNIVRHDQSLSYLNQIKMINYIQISIIQPSSMIVNKFINFTAFKAITLNWKLAASSLAKRPTKIDNAFNWEPLMETLREDDKELIRKICSPKTSSHEVEKINMQLVGILDYRPNKINHPQFIALILVGANRSKNFLHFRERALKMYLSQGNEKDETEPASCAEIWEELVTEITEIFYEFYTKMESKNKIKIKTQYFNFLQAKERYINSIPAIHKMLIIFTKIVYESSFIIDMIKFSKFTQRLLAKVQAKIIEDPSLALHVDWRSDNSKISPRVMVDILKTLNLFVIRESGIQLFFLERALSEDYFIAGTNQQEIIRMYMSAYRYCSSYDRNGKNQILQKLKLRCRESLSFKKQLLAYEPFYTQFTFFAILNQRLAHQYQNAASYLINGMVVIKEVQKPEFDEFEIQYFKAHEKTIMNGKTNVKNMILACYPELVSQKTVTRTTPTAEKYESHHIDNEIVTRMSLALKMMGLKFERQVSTKLKKQVDFLLVDLNVVLECDGDYHVDYKRIDLLSKTATRNMIILLEGYKMISISISEFNKDRKIGELAKLIQNKLKLLQEHNAICVL